MNSLKANAWGGGPIVSHSAVPQFDEDFAGQGYSHGYQSFQVQDPNQKMRKKRSFMTAFSEWWLLEIWCLFLSVAASAGLIVILYKYNGKRIQDWPWSISPNSVLAVFSTAIKTLALLPIADCLGQLKWTWFARGKPLPLLDFEKFDAASRGILGSIDLLWRLKFKHIASLGCIVTILAIAIDPLTQQALSQPTRMIQLPGASASVQRAQNYTISKDSIQDADDYIMAPNSLVGALYVGLYTPLDQEVAFPNPICSTGNCTFPNYQSLGVCQETKDVTEQRDSTCAPCVSSNNTETCHLACNMVSSFLNVTTLPGRAVSPSSPDTQSPSLGFPDMEWPIANILLNYRSNFSVDRPRTESPFQLALNGTRMWETVFYYCVQEFATNETNGKPITTVISTSTKTTNDSSVIGHGVGAQQLTVHAKAVGKEDEEAYVIAPDAWLATARAMYKAFTGGVGWAGIVTSFTDVGRVLGTIVDQNPPKKNPNSTQQMVAPQAPNNYTALVAIMENVARAMSNDIKAHPGNGTAVIFHDGTANSLESFIKVEWQWLSLLFATVPLSILLLALTMIRSSMAHIEVWKTNSLPGLQILGQETKNNLGRTENITLMEDKAKEVRVELEQRSDGWGFAGR